MYQVLVYRKSVGQDVGDRSQLPSSEPHQFGVPRRINGFCWHKNLGEPRDATFGSDDNDFK
jgi:hypothetical protein